MNDLALLTKSLEQLNEFHADVLAARKKSSELRLEVVLLQLRRRLEMLRSRNRQLKQQVQLLRAQREFSGSKI